MISELYLKNFVAFKELKLEFSPKINIIIGENSCGKTQVLKSIYALANKDKNSADDLFRLFKPHKQTLASLYHRSGSGDAQLSIKDSNSQSSEISFANNARNQIKVSSSSAEGQCLFIPTKEILSLLPAIESNKVDGEGLNALFDSSVIDLCGQVLKAPSSNTNKLLNSDPRAETIAPMLAETVGGKFVIDGSDQYFVAGHYQDTIPQGSSKSKQAKIYADYTELKFEKSEGTETSVTMTAEGYRKIGLLQRLLENGTLTQSGATTVLWDEPESNMNPSLIKMLVECLLTLSRNGQQVILATHDYVLLKWFDLLVESQKGDHITYHALYRDKNKSINIESKSNYKMLSENAISDTYSELTKAQVILKERDLEFDFSDAVDAILFDEMNNKFATNYHGVAEMHRVDFVVEFKESIVFVEVKDPGNPKAEEEGLQKFKSKLDNGTLANSFVSKYIESFIYRWAEDKLNKPIDYLILVTLDIELLGNLTDEIVRKMPPMNNTVPRWTKQFVNNCQVFNIESWNENFPKWSVKRVLV